MKHSTRLGVLGAMGLAVSACGGDDGAKLDPAKLAGEWRTIAAESSVQGVMVLDPTNAAGGYDSVASTGVEGAAGALAVDGDTITIGDSSMKASYEASPERLTFSDRSIVYERIPHAPADTITIAGKVTNSAGLLDTPRVALLSILRDNATGGLKFFVVPTSAEPGIDVAVDFTDAATVDYTLARAEGALGVERITFGTTGFAAVNAIVAYEDRDHDGKIGRFDIDACTDAAKDCIRGIAPLVLAARDGDSTELQAAGYGLMREGWALSVVVPDARRTGGTTLLPLDPAAPPSVDVTFAEDPTTPKFPNLKF